MFHRGRTALAVVLLAASVAACGSGESASPRSQEGQSSPSHQTPRTPATVSLPDKPSKLADVVVQQIQASQTVHVAVTRTDKKSGDKIEKITADMRLGTQGKQAASVTVVEYGDNGSHTSKGILVDGAFYAKSPGAQLMPNKPWMRLSQKDLESVDVGPFKMIFQTLLDELNKTVTRASVESRMKIIAHGDVSTSERASHNGKKVKRYEGKTDIAELAQQTDNRSYDALADAGMSTIPWKLSVDKHGLPRQLTTTTPTKNGGKIVNHATYTDWGKPVDIQPPPGSKVATLQDFEQRTQG